MFSSVLDRSARPCSAWRCSASRPAVTATAASSVSTVAIQPSSYVVRDAATTTTAAGRQLGRRRGALARSSSPTSSQSDDDVPYNIAIMFDVDLDELRNFNGWDEDFAGFPGVGGTVRIPPGAKFIDPTATTTTAASQTPTTPTRRRRRRRPAATAAPRRT